MIPGSFNVELIIDIQNSVFDKIYLKDIGLFYSNIPFNKLILLMNNVKFFSILLNNSLFFGRTNHSNTYL
jgi:hypothetical protein